MFDDKVPEGLSDPQLGAFRAGITTPFIATSFAWYWARASPVECSSCNSADGGDPSVLALFVGVDVQLWLVSWL